MKRRQFIHSVGVGMTALAMPGDREKCLAAGADEYMSKPVSLRNLSALVDVLLKNPPLFQQETSSAPL